MSIWDIASYAMSKFSQHGEDGILSRLLEIIGCRDGFCVEIGADDGFLNSNTRYLRERGWKGVMFDLEPCGDVIGEKITPENVNDVFKKHSVSDDFEVLSLDIDGNDFWVWKAIVAQPKIVIVEFNSNFDKSESKTIAYNSDHKWDGTRYFGATLTAFVKLGKQKGYSLVHVHQVNAFFVRDDLLPEPAPIVDYLVVPRYVDAPGRPWVEV